MYLSIDIGGSYLKYAILDKEFRLLKKWQKKTLVLPSKTAFFNYLCQELSLEGIQMIAVSCPGIIDYNDVLISKPAESLKMLYLAKLNHEIQSRLNRPVAVINDARAAGLCEVTMGNGKNRQSSVYWLIGTGIGGAIFQGNQLIKGMDNLAGEFSHLPLGFAQGKVKSLSSISSIPALISIYERQFAREQGLSSEEICEAYLKGEPQSRQAVEEWCLNIVQGLHIVRIFINPEIICIGGGISQADWFIKKIKGMFYNQIDYRFKEIATTKIDRCLFNNDSNLIGAAINAKKKIN